MPTVSRRGVLVLLSAVCTLGCQMEQVVTDTYQRPAEINMAGRENVVLDNISGHGGRIITSRLKQALIANGFTVLDRDAWDRIVAEETIGHVGQGVSDETPRIVRASVLIKGEVIRHDMSHSTTQATQTRSDGLRMTVYSTTGRAVVETSFDITDLQTTEFITSTSIRANKEGRTDYYPQPPAIDPGPLFAECYDRIAAQFMRKIAPYAETVKHKVYPIKEIPQSSAGIALLQANDPAGAIAEFEAALDVAKTLPKVDPNASARLTHNLAVAYEKSQQFELAMAKYTEAARLIGSPDQSANIARCSQRIRDRERLRDQGVTVQ
jgi:tetratricopeptide (TPR) repeat protein